MGEAKKDKRQAGDRHGFVAKEDARHKKVAAIMPGLVARATEPFSYGDLTAKVRVVLDDDSLGKDVVGSRMRDVRKPPPVGRGWHIETKGHRKRGEAGHHGDLFLLDHTSEIGLECDPKCPADECPTNVRNERCPPKCKLPFRRRIDMSEFGGGTRIVPAAGNVSGQALLGDFAAPAGAHQGGHVKG